MDRVGTTRIFRAVLRPPGFIEIPSEVMASFEGRVRVPVILRIRGVEFRSTTFRMADTVFVPIGRELRARTEISLGQDLRVELEEDLERAEERAATRSPSG